VVPAHAATGVDPAFGKIAVGFERNEGQFDSKVRFLARGQGYGLFLTDSEAVMRFTGPNATSIRMKLLGQSRNAKVEGLNALPGTINYLIGTSQKRRTGIRSYQKVRYSSVYSGIDVEYHGNGRSLEYDFIVQPDADPTKIHLGFSGIR